MIEFIQDYVTKALPPESFKDKERVERSPESELYFVRLGVAGFVVKGEVVDQDYQPIVRKTVVAVVTTDRRFTDTGRGGEVIGLDAPQRATSGPGNAVVLSGQPHSTTLDDVTLDQLKGDLAAAAGQFVDYRTFADSEIARLQNLIEAGNVAFQEMNNSHVTDKDALRIDVERLTGELADEKASHASLQAEYKAAREQLDAKDVQIADLEARLAASAAKATAKSSAAK